MAEVHMTTVGPRRSRVFAAVLAGLAAGVVGGGARAGTAEDARAYLDKANAAFALSRYPVAAENFERAFELTPDPALLYNAAQAYRLAGNKQRALELYQSYLRMYGTEKREEIEKHVEDLKRAIEQDKAVATSPPTTTEPLKGSPGAAVPAPAGAAESAETTAAVRALPPPHEKGGPPVLVDRPVGGATDDRPLTRKPWFWATVGGGALAAALVVLLLASGGEDPASASIGRVSGN
jgi:tetratricopeptide (TPR) repeat protein